MNKDLIDAITTFEKMYRDFQACKAELDNKKDLLDYLNSLNENSLSDFDRTHKDEYIFAQIGEKPVEPLIFGKDKWIVRVARWEDSRRKVEKSYYEYFSKERENLQMEKVYERRSYAMQDYSRLSDEYEQKNL